MKKEAFDAVKKEMKYIGLLFLLAIMVFKIVFFKENFIIVLRVVLSLFWLFAVPGYVLMLYWSNLEFMERLIIGIALAAGINGIFSYYIGLMGLNIKYHTALLPLAMIAIGLIVISRKN